MIQFGPWKIPEDEIVPEAGRYERAKFLPNKRILWYDAEEKRAQIAGQKGSVYSVSLENCTCLDFCARELPCKHMIWLALKLGHRFENVPEFDPFTAAKYKAEDIISLLEAHWRKGELSYDAFQKCVVGLRSSVSLAENLCHKEGKASTMDEAQITLNSFSSPVPTVNSNDIALSDATGCCSRYHECSAAKRCLIPERDYARNCLYRKNLAAGCVFYGSAANGFSSELFGEIQQHMNLLSPKARIILENLLIDFCEYNRSALHVVVRNSVYLDEIAPLGLFSFEPLGANFPPRKSEQWNYKKILLSVLDDPTYALSFKSAQAARSDELHPLREALKAARTQKDKKKEKQLDKELKSLYRTKPGEDTKEFLRQWLNTKDGIPLRDKLSNPYRMATIPSDRAQYVEELWRTCLFETIDQRIYQNTPYYEDDVLSLSAKSSEESRRIRLSRGYTTDEKNTLLATLSFSTPDAEPILA